MHMNLNIKSKFPKHDDNIKIRDIYHIRCNPDIGLGKCAIRQIPCACQEFWLSIEQLWKESVDADKQTCHSGHVVDFKYASILGAYNRWYIVDLVFSHTAEIKTDVDYIEEVQETIIGGISSFFTKRVFISNYGAFQTDYVATSGYYIVQWTPMQYILAEP